MTARHLEVADALRRGILAGEYPVGAQLPPESRLAAIHRVSTPTLRDALDVLRSEGLVRKFQGRGNFVSRPRQRLSFPYGDLPDDLHVTVAVAEAEATAELAAHLGCLPDEPVVAFTCRSVRGEDPQALTDVHVRPGLPGIANSAADAGPWGDGIVRRLQQALSAAELTCHDQVTARFPTPAEAQFLRIGVRVPVLAVHRTVRDDRGRVLACIHIALAGDCAEASFVTEVRGPHPAP